MQDPQPVLSQCAPSFFLSLPGQDQPTKVLSDSEGFSHEKVHRLEFIWILKASFVPAVDTLQIVEVPYK